MCHKFKSMSQKVPVNTARDKKAKVLQSVILWMDGRAGPQYECVWWGLLWELRQLQISATCISRTNDCSDDNWCGKQSSSECTCQPCSFQIAPGLLEELTSSYVEEHWLVYMSGKWEKLL